MCFFEDLFLSLCMIVCLYFIYRNYALKNRYGHTIENYILFLLVAFTLCFIFPSIVRYFFLDLFIILAYKERRWEVGLLLSIPTMLASFLVPMISTSWMVLLLGGYFVIEIFFPENLLNREESALVFKGFLISFVLFQRNTLLLTSLLIVFLLLLIEHLLLFKLTPFLVKVKDVEESMDDLEKNLFKITHEIKNPIAVCKGYLDMMDPKDVKKTERYLPILKNEVERTLLIMNDFMSLRNVTIHPDIMDFYLLMEDLKDTVELLLRKHECALEIPTCNEELFLFADYDRLKQVFMNLIKNSLEAGSNSISLDTKIKNDKLIIEILDNGSGISKESLSHLGELFFTTKPTGTGVGVHLSKEIIRLHHGTMKYSSRGKRGTKVVITLPIQEDGGILK